VGAYVDAVLADDPVHFWSCDQASGSTATDTGSDPVDLDLRAPDSFIDTASICDIDTLDGDCFELTHSAFAHDLTVDSTTPPDGWKFDIDLFSGPWSVEWWGAPTFSANPYDTTLDPVEHAEDAPLWSFGSDSAWDVLCYNRTVFGAGVAPELLARPNTYAAGAYVAGPIPGPPCQCLCDYNVVTWEAPDVVRMWRGSFNASGDMGALFPDDPYRGFLPAYPGTKTFRWFAAKDDQSGIWKGMAGAFAGLAIYDKVLTEDRIRAHWLAGVARVDGVVACFGGFLPSTGQRWSIGEIGA